MIAILAPFFPYNYGTVLQAYALHLVLNELGYDSEYISYNFLPNNIIGKIHLFIKFPSVFKNVVKQKWKNFCLEGTGDNYVNMILKNNEFIKLNIPHTSKVYDYFSINEISDSYQYYLTGSDQTLSPLNPFYKVLPYYQEFVKNNSKKKSFACSLGIKDLPESYKKFIKKRMNSFTNICLREEYSSNTLRTLLNKDVKFVLDPTLLIPCDYWAKHEVDAGIKKTFVFCYLLGTNRYIIDYANNLANTLDTELVVVQSNNIVDDERVLSDIGVQEFIWLIHHAQYIVTDSFHGTIFAINFKKQFSSFNKHLENLSDNGRIGDILKRLDLSDHLLSAENMHIPTYISYEKISPKLNSLIEDSKSYLKSIL